MLTKLKYAGVSRGDLLDIYTLYIRSRAEYCSVAFHSSLTVQQSASLEKIQSTCLKIILQDNYQSYSNALQITGLETLAQRREGRCLNFSLKAIEHPQNSRLFPFNDRLNDYNMRVGEPFKVNEARTNSYMNSAIPYCQRLLNNHFQQT